MGMDNYGLQSLILIYFMLFYFIIVFIKINFLFFIFNIFKVKNNEK